MRDFSNVKTIVLKIGSSSLLDDKKEISKTVIVSLAEQINTLVRSGKHVILVTSGAVAVGAIKLETKPKNMAAKQACAAVGQASLINMYDNVFTQYGLKCAQILVNHDDFDYRNRMINLKNTLNFLLKENVIPIINENDALATEEIKVGDNDTLAALIAAAIKAELLILLSDVNGLYNKNPQLHNDAVLIEEIGEISEDIESMGAASVSAVGTGGMMTKIKAAKIANSAAVEMVIMNSSVISQITEVVNGEVIGTLFKRNKEIKSRDHWLLYNSYGKGKLIIDDGAKEALINHRKSLLPSGIIEVEGIFDVNAIVAIADKKCKCIAKGIVNYNSEEIRKIKGLSTDDVRIILGYPTKKEIVHANDMIIIKW